MSHRVAGFPPAEGRLRQAHGVGDPHHALGRRGIERPVVPDQPVGRALRRMEQGEDGALRDVEVLHHVVDDARPHAAPDRRRSSRAVGVSPATRPRNVRARSPAGPAAPPGAGVAESREGARRGTGRTALALARGLGIVSILPGPVYSQSRHLQLSRGRPDQARTAETAAAGRDSAVPVPPPAVPAGTVRPSALRRGGHERRRGRGQARGGRRRRHDPAAGEGHGDEAQKQRQPARGGSAPVSYWQTCCWCVGTQTVSRCPFCLTMVSEWPSTVMVWQFCADPRGGPGRRSTAGAAPSPRPGGARWAPRLRRRSVRRGRWSVHRSGVRRHDIAAGQASRGQTQEQRHGHGPRHAGTTRSEELALMGASLNSLDCPG